MVDNLGLFIKIKRIERNLLQSELADIVGCTNSCISAIENGIRPGSDNLLKQIAIALNLTDEENRIMQELSIKSRGEIPNDISNYLLNNNCAIRFIKAAIELGLTPEEWNKLIGRVKIKHYVLLNESHLTKESSIAEIEKRELNYVPLYDESIIQFQFFDSINNINDLIIRNGHRENISGWYYIGTLQRLEKYREKHPEYDNTFEKWIHEGINNVVITDVGNNPIGITNDEIDNVLSSKARKKRRIEPIRREWFRN